MDKTVSLVVWLTGSTSQYGYSRQPVHLTELLLATDNLTMSKVRRLLLLLLLMLMLMLSLSDMSCYITR